MTQEIYSLPTNGKGDKPRPYKPDIYAREYERIFGKKKAKPEPRKGKEKK